MSDLVGATLGRYQVIARLGRGGMADVYKAFQPSLDRYVAVKVLHSSMVEDEEFVRRFQREAKNVARLRHPNIIQVLDYDNQGDTYYMVTEYLDGPTLKAALEELHRRNEEMPIHVALRIVSDMGAALAYAHEMGVVHRDVKPANIMLDRAGRVILTDFGVAKMLTGTKVTVTGTVLGTPAYMSPEQGMGEPGDARSDIYSLGVVLYELATGRLPYDADTPLAVLLKHAHDPLPLPRLVNPALPEEIERIILRALAKDPADRYQTVQAMLGDITALPPATVPSAQPGALDTRSLAARAPQDLTSAPPPPTPPSPSALPPTPPPAGAAAAAPRRSYWLGGGALAAVFVCVGLAVAGALVLFLAGDDLLRLASPPQPSPAPSSTAPPPTAGPTLTFIPRPTRTPRPSATPLGPPGAVIFEDSFGDPESGWDRFEGLGGGADYGDGIFRIWVDEVLSDYWSTAGYDLDDVRLSVSTFKVGGPDDNDFGLICRYRDDDNFYALLISSDGYAGVMMMQDGETSWPEQDGMQTSDAIFEGASVNEITAECIGDRLALHVNGELVVDVRDATFGSGDVGLMAGTFEEGGVEIHFDDFTAHEP
jgi:serine/threonine-protein kinase